MVLWGDGGALEGKRRAIKAEYCEMLLLAGEGFALASSAAAAKHFDVWGGE